MTSCATRLGAKARQRNKSRIYRPVDEIYKNIVDLAGARLALYDPQMDKPIRANFELIGPPKEISNRKQPDV